MIDYARTYRRAERRKGARRMKALTLFRLCAPKSLNYRRDRAIISGMETIRKCVLVGGAPTGGVIPAIAPDDFAIAVDAGYRVIAQIRKPDLAVGDFDSLGYVPTDTETLEHPAQKDDTDTGLAMQEAYERGMRVFDLYCALGGRLDHTLATIQTCTHFARKGCRVTAFGAREILHFVTDRIVLPKRSDGGYLSVFAIGRAVGVCERGVAYPLTDAILCDDDPLGVSNEIVDDFAEITVKDGVLIVVEQARDEI